MAAVERAETEFVEPLVQIKTPPCDSVDAAIHASGIVFDRFVAPPAARDQQLLPIGTRVTDERVAVVNASDSRIDVQREVVGPAVAHARYSAGTSFHVEAVDPLVQLRPLTALDSVFSPVTTTPYSRSRRVAT